MRMNPLNPRRILLSQIVALLALTFFAYGGVGLANFSYDDIPLIIENPYLRSPEGVLDLPRIGRPVRAISLWLDYQIWGLDPRNFHRVNHLLHIFCVVSAFFLLRLIFQNQRVAFLAASIYALNPITSEAVSNVAHRKELLCFFFLSLSLMAFKKSRANWRWLLLSFICYLFSLLSKQVALVLPLLMVLEEFLFARPGQRQLKRVALISAGYVLVPVLAFVFSLSDFKLFSQFQPVDFLDRSYWSILATQFKYFPKYLWMAFFPAHLNVDHYIEYAHSFSDPKALFGLLLFLTSLALLSALVLRRSPIAFALGWLLLNLLPVLNFIPSNQIFAERYLYIPSLGAEILLALALDKASRVWSRRLASKSARFGLFLGFNFIFLSFYFAHYIYRGYPELWSQLSPPVFESGAVFIIGASLISLPLSIIFGFWSNYCQLKKIKFYQELIFFVLMITLGFVLSEITIASLAYHRLTFPLPDFLGKAQVSLPGAGTNPFALKTSPTWLLFYFIYILLAWGIMLGTINRFSRRLAENKSDLLMILLSVSLLFPLMLTQTQARARKWVSERTLWMATVLENPESFVGWNNLGRAYVQRNKLSQAMLCFAMAHSVKPYSIEPILNLGNTSLRLGNLEGAEHYYRWALLLDPNSFVAQLNLGNCLASRKEYHQAIASYLEALRIKPDSFEATYNLALCFLELGDRSRAQLYLLKTLQLAPEHHPSRILLEQLKKPQR